MTERVEAHLLMLCRMCADEGATIDQINGLMPKLMAMASVMVAREDQIMANERLNDIQATRH